MSRIDVTSFTTCSNNLRKDEHPDVDDLFLEASYLHRHYRQVSPTTSCCCVSPHDVYTDALRKDCDDLGCDENQVLAAQHSTETAKMTICIRIVASTVIKSGTQRDNNIRREKMSLVLKWKVHEKWGDFPCIITERS